MASEYLGSLYVSLSTTDFCDLHLVCKECKESPYFSRGDDGRITSLVCPSCGNWVGGSYLESALRKYREYIGNEKLKVVIANEESRRINKSAEFPVEIYEPDLIYFTADG